MSTSTEDDCTEVLSLLRGAARTPLLGMTTEEIEEITRLNASRVKSCVDSLLARDAIMPMGERKGQNIYGINPEDA